MDFKQSLKPGEVAQFIVVFKTIEVGNFTNIVTAGSGETPNKPAENTTLVYNTTDDILHQIKQEM